MISSLVDSGDLIVMPCTFLIKNSSLPTELLNLSSFEQDPKKMLRLRQNSIYKESKNPIRILLFIIS